MKHYGTILGVQRMQPADLSCWGPIKLWRCHVNEGYSGIIGELVEDDVALVIDDRVLTRLGVGYVIDVHMKYIR